MSPESVLLLALVTFVLAAAALGEAQRRAWRAHDQARQVGEWIERQNAQNADLVRTMTEAIGLASIGAVDEANALIRHWNAKQREGA